LVNQKPSSLSFMEDLKFISSQLNLDTTYAIENIRTILENYKKFTLEYDDTIDKSV
jgi:hypothetical protein